MQLITPALLLAATFIVTWLYYSRRPMIALPADVKLAPSVSLLKLAYDIYIKGYSLHELGTKYQEEFNAPVFTFHVPFYGDIGLVSNKETVKKFFGVNGFFGAIQVCLSLLF